MPAAGTPVDDVVTEVQIGLDNSTRLEPATFAAAAKQWIGRWQQRRTVLNLYSSVVEPLNMRRWARHAFYKM